jgi:hypothetical protein
LVDSTKLSKKVKETEVCTEFIPVDGAADEAQVLKVRSKFPSFCKGLSEADLVYVGSLLDENKVVSEIFLDYNVEVSLPAAEVNWKYGVTAHPHQVQINAATLRPQSQVDGLSWEQNALSAFGLEDKKELFKGCKYLQEFILKYKALPNRDELAVFYYNRVVEAGKRSTLPFLTEEWSSTLLQRYIAAVGEEVATE